jgi:hypothetical protein
MGMASTGRRPYGLKALASREVTLMSKPLRGHSADYDAD